MTYFAKYDVPAPRYTSYPTVPYWTDAPSTADWLDSISRAMSAQEATWSIYIHIPFCESLCIFCGCHKTVTQNHRVEGPYVETVLREFELYRAKNPALLSRKLRVMHLGGGTPTFLSSDHLKRLLEPMLAQLSLAEDFEGSIEIDPRRVSKDQLATLHKLGIRRVSLGVQDFNEEVQRIVNRVQPVDVTQRAFDLCRELGFHSINLDLIYGLPGQNLAFMEHTMAETLRLRPDRIALYSFALVPWLKPQQRSFKPEEIPAGKEKRDLYERARLLLLEHGYVEIGMDHFALATDSLSTAMREGRLHRNFMGYTDVGTDLLLGLGVSSISETADCYHQNEKAIPQYSKRVGEGMLATAGGHKLSVEDQKHKHQILQLMTTGTVKLEENQLADIKEFLSEMVRDGLIHFDVQILKITESGKPFLRNACMALDQRMRAQALGIKIFSQSM